eukprot:2726651-Ditylum_brightwellii.AAC.1
MVQVPIACDAMVHIIRDRMIAYVQLRNQLNNQLLIRSCQKSRQGQSEVGLGADVVLTYWLASGKTFFCDVQLTSKYATA